MNLSIWVGEGKQLLFLEEYLRALWSVNAEVTNALKKNIFVSSRHYKNVLLWFNHEFTQSEHPAKKSQVKRQRAPPSPVWVSKTAVQGRQQDVWGAMGKKSGAPSTKVTYLGPSGQGTKHRSQVDTDSLGNSQIAKKSHRSSFQPWSCQ